MTNEIPFENIHNKLKLFYNICIENLRPEFKTPIPLCYENLIKKCWQKNPDERPTFDEIVNELKNNDDFITGDANKDEYYDYTNHLL